MSLALPTLVSVAPHTAYERLIRNALFVACFLLVTFTAAPFPDLGNPNLLDPVGEGNPYGQILTTLMTTALCAFVLIKAPRPMLRGVSPALIIMLAWIAITAAFSPYPGLALRRSLLATMTIANAGALLLLPLGREHFARLLAFGSFVVLASCYIGVALFPRVSIHQVTDVIESALAGAWRGPFGHKNGAGANMVVLIFIGIFVARAASRAAGLAIIAGAAVFLVFTNSKSPIVLLPLTLLLSFVLLQLRSSFLQWALIIATLLIANVLTVGTVIFEPIGNLLTRMLPDATFTGRDVIWRFALEQVLIAPISGHGFQAFWGTSALLFNWDVTESWGLRASDAHNAYLNLAVMIGLVGLALSLVWIVIQPLIDLSHRRQSGYDPAITLLFIQIWIFGLLLSATESVLLSGGDSVWFLMIVSIIGLRLQRVTRLNE